MNIFMVIAVLITLHSTHRKDGSQLKIVAPFAHHWKYLGFWCKRAVLNGLDEWIGLRRAHVHRQASAPVRDFIWPNLKSPSTDWSEVVVLSTHTREWSQMEENGIDDAEMFDLAIGDRQQLFVIINHRRTMAVWNQATCNQLAYSSAWSYRWCSIWFTCYWHVCPWCTYHEQTNKPTNQLTNHFVELQFHPGSCVTITISAQHTREPRPSEWSTNMWHLWLNSSIHLSTRARSSALQTDAEQPNGQFVYFEICEFYTFHERLYVG